MTQYYKQDNAFIPQSESTIGNIHKRLPPGNYVIKASPGGLYFDKYDKEFDLGFKIYGDAHSRAKRIINTFLDRKNSTGVLLTGEKGSGKTLLGKLISHMLAVDHGVPTIFVTEPWSGDVFLNLIGSIDQPAIIFFDEFEKVYDGKSDDNHGNHNQSQILTLLDGIFTTQKLFILTCNDRYEIDRHMINRPGRIFYAFDYRGISEDFVRDFCADTLVDKDKVEGVVKVGSLFRDFNFDMLKSLVEEMNRYDEEAMECLLYLNINPEYDDSDYDVLMFPCGSERPLKNPNPSTMKTPVGRDKFLVYTYELPPKKRSSSPAGSIGSSFTIEDAVSILDDEDGQTYTGFNFTQNDISLITSEKFELVNTEGDRLVLLKQKPKFDWRAL